MQLPTMSELEEASKLVYQSLLPSPQLHWPLLSEHCGCEVWVKHENHLPTGAFKVRGGLVYINRLRQREPDLAGLVTATRGNHGQSIAFAAGREGIRSLIVVPEGNNPEKNHAMQSLGGELVVHGRDFDEASQYAHSLAVEQGLHRIPSLHIDLILGVASYATEFLKSQPDLQRIYVPIGLGSGICGVICARNALGLKTEIVGVVSDAADCYALSLAAGECVSTESANTLADGMAVRIPNPEALAMMLGNVSRIVRVTDQEVLTAMSLYFTATHNIAEGAGAAPLAALCREREQNIGAKVGLVLSGGNVDRALYKKVLAA
jgi:threonine dehydratase